MSASIASDRSLADGDDTDIAPAPIADDTAKSCDSKAPPPPPVFIEFKRCLANKGGGIAKRSAQLQAGAGDGAAAPTGSPPSARDRSGSGTAPRRATVAGGARSTGGGIAARRQKNGGGAGIVLPGTFEAPPPLPLSANRRVPLCAQNASARSCRRPACKPARRRTRALIHASNEACASR